MQNSYVLLWCACICQHIKGIFYFTHVSHTCGHDNSLSQIDVQLRKRADLIPNLIKTVKGYAKHEKAAIKEVTEARKALVGAQGIEAKVNADKKLESALKSIFAIAENYPDLKANQNFHELQLELSSTEDKIAYSRQFYNDTVMTFNTKRESFPAKIIAGWFKFVEKEFFKAKEEEKKPVKVKF